MEEFVKQTENNVPTIREKKSYNPGPRPWRWQKGQSGNPKGRPKGDTLKDYVRKRFANMPEEERLAFLNSVSPELAWKMGEGNPKESADITSGGQPIPLIPERDGSKNNKSKKTSRAKE